MATAARARTFTVGIAGASGYAGQELQRLLAGHPSLGAVVLQARSDPYDDLDAGALTACEIVFLALPHGASRRLGEALAAAGTPVVDLGSDFRGEWTYGLPELARDAIAGSTAVAAPGCYATAAILALAPLARAGLLDGPVAIDGKSGVSGAGREPSGRSHLPNLHGGVVPYSPTGHRHVAEIERALGVRVSFTPHLLPTSRGLAVTAYARLAEPAADLGALYRGAYADERFVRLSEAPAPQRLSGSNVCEVAVWSDPRTQMAICCAALDNLVKGAAGQAIQCANLMLGLDEPAGLPERGLWP